MDKPPADIADHAIDYSWRNAEPFDIEVGQVMIDLGLTNNQMGARDPFRPGGHHVFHPEDRTGGSITHAGQVTVDSGILNPGLLDKTYDEATGRMWRQLRLKPRIEAIIAHEVAEHEQGGDHELALIAGAETKLPVSFAAREMLRQMERGFRIR